MSGAVAGLTFAALHGVVGVLTLSLAGIAPWWVVLAMTAVWVALARTGWRIRRRTPVVTMLVPIGYAGLLLATLALGVGRLGWTA